MGLSGEIRLEGRLFNACNYDVINVLNEHYLMKYLRASGLDKVMPQENESNEQYLARLQAALVDTLLLPEILAGYLLPAGKSETDWTPQMAADTATFIKGITERESKEEIHRLGLIVVMDFFRAGVVSLQISLNALRSAPDPTPTPRNPPERYARAGH